MVWASGSEWVDVAGKRTAKKTADDAAPTNGGRGHKKGTYITLPGMTADTLFFGTLRPALDASSDLVGVFAELQHQFDDLFQQYNENTIDLLTLGRALTSLRCSDVNGVEWTLGATTAEWYARQGSTDPWVLTSPNASLMDEADRLAYLREQEVEAARDAILAEALAVAQAQASLEPSDQEGDLEGPRAVPELGSVAADDVADTINDDDGSDAGGRDDWDAVAAGVDTARTDDGGDMAVLLGTLDVSPLGPTGPDSEVPPAPRSGYGSGYDSGPDSGYGSGGAPVPRVVDPFEPDEFEPGQGPPSED